MSHESGPGGNNGKRAVAWDYFDIKSQKQHLLQHRETCFHCKRHASHEDEDDQQPSQGGLR